VKDMKN